MNAEQIANDIIKGYETDSGVVMGIRWAQIPALRALLIEAAKRAGTALDPNLLLAVEFGYKCCEKGMNIEMARVEFAKVMEGDK